MLSTWQPLLAIGVLRERPRDIAEREKSLFEFSGSTRILVLGYGNSEFLDEGLGPALVEAISGMELPGVELLACDGLDLESAVIAARYDIVVFAAAALSGPAPFAFKPIRPAKRHSAGRATGFQPDGLLCLVERLYGRTPEGFGLAIRGSEFGAGVGLSPDAEQHLGKAVAFLEAAIRLRLAA